MGVAQPVGFVIVKSKCTICLIWAQEFEVKVVLLDISEKTAPFRDIVYVALILLLKSSGMMSLTLLVPCFMVITAGQGGQGRRTAAQGRR